APRLKNGQAVTDPEKVPNQENPTHDLPPLFSNPALPTDPENFNEFIATHPPLKRELPRAVAFSGSRSRTGRRRNEIDLPGFGTDSDRRTRG
ncbi:hypothetical protein, partial [Pseudomonas fluorescens]|uniref:hypothetical protein n=1 Tax=Pseudomonas fluorescens TaxID=294 RepID=UPI001CD46BF0